MPDPPIVPTPEQVEDTKKMPELTDAWTNALGNLNGSLDQVAISGLNFNNIQQTTITIFDKLSQSVSDFSSRLSNLSTFNDTNSASFGLMSAALIKTDEAFRNFGNVDKGRLSGFTDQFDKLFKTIKESPMTSAGKAAIELLTSSLKGAGASANQVEKAIADAKKGVTDFARSILVGSDNMLHFQNAIIQTAASQGNMQKLLDSTGAGFKNLNSFTQKNIDVMTNSMATTNSTSAQMQQYMDVLKNLPGGMSNFSDSVNIAGNETTLLTAAIKYAHGSGRDLVAVQKDMAQAMNEYGVNSENALKYSARMSEVSETLGARLEDVQGAISGSVEAFKSFVYGGVNASQMTKGLSDAMEMYVARLKGVGVPTKNAIEMAKSLQTAMASMSVGEEALVSQQTGGPGGIRGALQYERLMKEDPAAAMKKMDESLRKLMGGQLITEKGAEESESGASQFQKQVMLIQKFTGIKDRQQAEAMSEAMAKGEPLKMPEQKGSLNETTDRGEAIEQLSLSKIGEMNIKSDTVQLKGAIVNLSTVQDIMTARSGRAAGADGTGRGVNVNEQKRLKTTQRAHAGLLSPTRDIQNPIAQTITNSIMENPNIPSTTGTQDQTKKAIAQMPVSHHFGAGMSPYTPAYKQVGQAVASSRAATAATQGAAGVGGTGTVANQPMPVTLVGGSGITVNFTGKCPHCGWDVHTSEQARIQSAPSQSSNKG